MMTAHGLLFLGKTRPLVTTAADGTFAVTLLAVDRLGPHQVEPWRITWSGPDAAQFWQERASAMQPGQPLAVELERIRTFTNGRNAPEFHAAVRALDLAPVARRSVAPGA